MRKGDFVKISFVGRIVGTGEIFDLTDEKVAKEQGIYNPKQKYGPIFVIIGAKMTIPGVEKNLEAMKINEEREFTVPYAEAYGQRDPKLIQIISMSNFKKDKINPIPGMFVTINNRQCRISSVSGGRIRVDFNHPLAGKNLHYKMKIVEHIKKTEDRIKELLDYYYIPEKRTFVNGKLTIEVEKEIGKELEKMISEIVKEWIPEVKQIKFVLKKKEEKIKIKKEIQNKK